MENKDILKEITEILIGDDHEHDIIFEASNKLFDLYRQLSSISLTEDSTTKNIQTTNGIAIGTTWAAYCSKDYVRTYRFIKGLYEAVEEKRKQHPNKKIQILYAGSGPFGTLAIPLTSIFSEKEIGITFLEINPESIKCLKNVIQELSVNSYITNIIECDASEYVLENNDIDIVLSETMLAALYKEPQVKISLNLLNQLNDDVILIPERISVDLGLLNIGEDTQESLKNMPYSYKTIKTLIELNKNYINQINIIRKFPIHRLSIKKRDLKSHPDLHFLTHITTFGENHISYKESGLTIPYRIPIQLTGDTDLNFQYTLGECPEFRIWED